MMRVSLGFLTLTLMALVILESIELCGAKTEKRFLESLQKNMKALRERLQKESQELKERLRKQAADLKEKMKLISEKAKNRTAELHDLHEAMNSTAEGSSQTIWAGYGSILTINEQGNFVRVSMKRQRIGSSPPSGTADLTADVAKGTCNSHTVLTSMKLNICGMSNGCKMLTTYTSHAKICPNSINIFTENAGIVAIGNGGMVSLGRGGMSIRSRGGTTIIGGSSISIG